VRADALAVDAADLMEAAPHHQRAGGRRAGPLVGALNSNDLMRAKVI
jgi:arabinose-5-phosphate isomerase